MWDHLSAANKTIDWWRYMKHVHAQCYSNINEDCSRRAHEQLNISWDDTQKCVAESFSTSNPAQWGAADTTNIKIDEEIKYWKQYGTNIYPSIVINQKTYRGQIEPMSVFNAVCAGFTSPPDQCLKTLHIEKTVQVEKLGEGKSTKVGAIVAIVVALILLNVLIVYCCRRKAKRDMNNEMQMQIESAVSQYFALTQKNGDSSNRT